MNTLLSDRLDLLERRRWRRLEERMDRIDDRDRLTILRALARDRSLVSVTGPEPASDAVVGPVELRIGLRRVGIARLHGGVWDTLRSAAAGGEVTLAGAGRYGPYWVLEFAGAGAPLAVLAERVRLLPDGAADSAAGGAAGAGHTDDPLALVAG